MDNKCKLCNVCNGKVCKNTIPGPGAKGVGDVAIRNFDKWKEIRVNMDTISDVSSVTTTTELFGRTFRMPVFAGPVGAVKLHYGDKFSDAEYNDILVPACREEGIAAFTGDGTDYNVMISACKSIKSNNGYGVPTVKPWDMETINKKIALVEDSGAFAMAMDIDAAGLPFLQNLNPPAGPKTVQQLREIKERSNVPFIIKGIMTVKGAKKAIEAGADAIIVSNHGGRVLDQCPSTAEVLPQIVEAVDGKAIILVDGGIRDGVDVFKALAMGADAVLMARPFVNAIYSQGYAGVANLCNKIEAQLKDTMSMCGASRIEEIDSTMIYMI